MTRTGNRRKTGGWIWIGIAICICVMLYAGFQIVTQTREDRQADDIYQSLLETVAAEQAGGVTVSDATVPQERVDMETLKQLNGNAVAWIYSEGTPIDYPVMQAGDNSYYLTHLHDKTANKAGSIFLDYRNAPDFSDQNSLLYGHHMKSGKMFAALESYKNQAYYDAHPTLTLQTQQGTYLVELIGGYVVDGADNDLKLNFESAEELAAYARQARERSTFDSRIEVDGQDRLVTMVTCTYDFSNARYALVGKLTSR